MAQQAQSWARDETKTALQKIVAGRVATGLGDMSAAAKCFAAAFVGDPCLRRVDDFADLQEMCLPSDLEMACEAGIDAAATMLEAALLRVDSDTDDGDCLPCISTT